MTEAYKKKLIQLTKELMAIDAAFVDSRVYPKLMYLYGYIMALEDKEDATLKKKGTK